MTRRARTFYTGQWISDLRDPLNRLVKVVNTGVEGSSMPGGLTFYATVALEVKTLNASTLTCVDPGAAAEQDAREYTVELPPTFTEASREGVAYVYTDINNRTADGTETQRLTPTYVVGDIIRAAYRLEGDGSLIDMNIDGRQWAKLP